MKSVAHLTSVHYRYDTRIFLKMCSSLTASNYRVYLIVSDGKGDEKKNDIIIYDVGASCGRWERIRNTPKRIFKKALELKVDLYHLHDPELLPVGLKLKKLGKKVVFDAHENISKQLLSKPYLNKAGRLVLSKAFSLYERYACRKLDAVISATPLIRDKYLKMGVRSIDINNFPLLDELAPGEIDWSKKVNQVCYVGSISQIRGVFKAVEAIGKVKSNARLQLVGHFDEEKNKKLVHINSGWDQVDALGFLDREEVGTVLQRSVGGLVTFLPSPNHIDAQPNKMFEYMSAGVPVIASNFSLWKQIVELNQCGVCVDPLDAQSIADIIDFLIQNPEAAKQMGINGKQAVVKKYNWSIEEEKLLEFYKIIIQ